MFRDLMTALGHDPDAVAADLATPEGLGVAAAKGVLLIRATDGSNAENDFADTTCYEPVNSDDAADPVVDPNAWTPFRLVLRTLRNRQAFAAFANQSAKAKVRWRC